MKKGWKLAVFGILSLLVVAIFTAPVGADPQITDVNIQDENSDGLYEPNEQITVTIAAEDVTGVDRIELSHLNGTMWTKDCGGANVCTFEQVLTHSKVGIHKYTAVAYNGAGETDTNTFEITIRLNQAPVAKIDIEQEWGYATLNVEFDCRESYDKEGTIVAYVLDFGDGETKVGTDISKLRVQHKYDGVGVYNVTLTVVDNLDASDQAKLQISVGRYAEFDHAPEGEKLAGLFVGTSDGELYISKQNIEMTAGEKVIVPLKVINMGEGISDYKLATSFSGAYVNPANFKLGYLEDMTGYVHINVAESGKHTLYVDLFQDGELISSEKIYITVAEEDSMNTTLFVLIGLLIVSLAGVIGLICLIFHNLKKKSHE